MATIDLRSDTVTRPSPGMREAMTRAEVGDDVYGEDPTVNCLQAVAARLVGKAAALFVPSGTMANQTAVRAHTQPGDIVLAAVGAHLLRYESGAAAALSGVQVHTLGRDGRFSGDDVRAAMHPSDHHYAPVTLVSIENTHNVSGGRVFPLDDVHHVAAAAREAGLALHLDGARLFNAVAATGIPASVWAAPFDTVSFCLSKGLGAPVGSLVCGSAAIIDRVHRFRKMFGGGMRQAGILAAAGLYALEHHVERLAADHANARRLAAGLRALDIDVESEPDTNMVLFRVDDGMRFLAAIYNRDLRINPVDAHRFRAVTHLDVTSPDIDDAVNRVREALVEMGAR